MVYSQICNWLDDTIGEDPPVELLDIWDLTEWVNESEILDIFKEVVLPSFKNKSSRDDAESILHALIWEYYLFRRDTSVASFEPALESVIRLKEAKGTKQQSLDWYLEKNTLLTASEFAGVLDNSRLNLLRNKLRPAYLNNHFLQTVFLSDDNGKIAPTAWGIRFEPVVRSVYEAVYGCEVYSEIGRLRHSTLCGLAASPDGLVCTGPRLGRLLEIKAPYSRKLEEEMVPYEYYCQMQVQMEVMNIGAVDYCECRFINVTSWDSIKCSGPEFVGGLAIIGDIEDVSGWRYIYSPLFKNDDEGRKKADLWEPELLDDETCLEKQTWAIQNWQVITVLRNNRWWSSVGLPEYELFFKDLSCARNDPMYLKPRDLIDPFPKPMFLDD